MKAGRLLVGLVTLAIVAAALDPALAQSSNKAVADEIIAIVKAGWAADMAKNTAESMKSVAEEYTEFNGDYATRLDGRAINVRLSDAGNKDAGHLLASEMLNEKVQVYDDVAILSYNFAGVAQNKDGKNEPIRAKSTRVYARQNGKWMLVHANFASDPLPK